MRKNPDQLTGSNEQLLVALLGDDPPADTQASPSWLEQYSIAAVLVADQFGLFDQMAPTAWVPLAELADKLRVVEQALVRLCRVLHCRALLEVDLGRSCVRLTAQARAYWRRDSILFRGNMLEEVRPGMASAPQPFYQERIQRMLLEGWAPARSEKATFTDMWERGSVEADVAVSFNNFMRAQSFPIAVAAARSGVYSGGGRFVDLGGGSACFALMVKCAYPDSACYILDLPEICVAAETYLRSFPALDIKLLPANFFSREWPIRADCVNMCNILHDWPLAKGMQILENAYENLEPGGRLILCEVLLDEDLLGPESAVVFDMLMYMNHKSQQYSFAQLKSLVERAGFVDLETAAAPFGDYTILAAGKPCRYRETTGRARSMAKLR